MGYKQFKDIDLSVLGLLRWFDGCPRRKKPSACLGCRSCEAVCPQQIKISEGMADFSAKLRRSREA